MNIHCSSFTVHNSQKMSRDSFNFFLYQFIKSLLNTVQQLSKVEVSVVITSVCLYPAGWHLDLGAPAKVDIFKPHRSVYVLVLIWWTVWFLVCRHDSVRYAFGVECPIPKRTKRPFEKYSFVYHVDLDPKEVYRASCAVHGSQLL